MAAQVKYNTFAKDVINGKHDFSSHVVKVLLSNSAPNVSTHAIKGDVTEITAQNGYSAGGVSCATITESQSGGTETVKFTSQTITASGGAIGPFQYAVFYNDSQTSPVKPLISYVDYGSSISLNAGESLNITFDATNGFLQIS